MEEIEKMQDKEVILKREFDKCLFPKQKQKQKQKKNPFFVHYGETIECWKKSTSHFHDVE